MNEAPWSQQQWKQETGWFHNVFVACDARFLGASAGMNITGGMNPVVGRRGGGHIGAYNVFRSIFLICCLRIFPDLNFTTAR